MDNLNHKSDTDPTFRKAMKALSCGAIKPKGWLLNQLVIQSKGLTGNLDKFWDSVGSYSGWLGGTGENWERGPYFCDGLVPLAYILQDNELIIKAKTWMEWSLNSQDSSGNFGPRNNEDWWPRMVMLKALIQYFEFTGDTRVLEFMTNYFVYQYECIRNKPLKGWGKARGGELLYSIYWLYDRLHDGFLLELAAIVFGQTLDWTEIFTEFPFVRETGFYYKWESLTKYSWEEMNQLMQFLPTHVVNVAMSIKQPGLYYMQSKNQRHKAAVFSGIENLMKYHGQVSGVFSGDEHLSGRNPTQGTELCAVVEYMFSLETLLEVFDEVMLSDVLEKIAYNALPATITRDFCAHQYLQQANQVLVTNAKRNWFNNADDSNTFGLEPNFGCCTANMHQGWPKLLKSLWMATDENGLAAVVYAPCSVNTKVGNGINIIIEEETEYPFDDTIKFIIHCKEKVRFPLKLRIPGWCKQASVKINGCFFCNCQGNLFARIDREWDDNDMITLHLPMEIKVSRWYKNSIGIERGPLVYALRIGEEWKKLKETNYCTDWEVNPTTPWNYALQIDMDCPDKSFMLEKKDVALQPFDSMNPPIILRGKGRKLKEWTLQNNSAGELPFSPVESEEPEEEIELIPYGAAKLRISEFPFTI